MVARSVIHAARFLFLLVFTGSFVPSEAFEDSVACGQY
jgi:hypothetical protein